MGFIDEVAFYKRENNPGFVYYHHPTQWMVNEKIEKVAEVGPYEVFINHGNGKNSYYYVIDSRDFEYVLKAYPDDLAGITTTLENIIQEEEDRKREEKRAAKVKQLSDRLKSYYRVIRENYDDSNCKNLIIINLTKIGFLNYLLYGKEYDMFHFEEIIEIVNKKYDTNFTVDDFYVEL
ncbi:hypothetical protein [Priestia megaterium]